LRAVGYSAPGQAAVNTIGTIATGWFSQLDNLGKRMGDIRLSAGSSGKSSDESALNGNAKSNIREVGFSEKLIGAHSNDFWVRAYGQQLNTKLGLGFADFREFQYGADVGIDHVFALNYDSALYIGVDLGYQSSSRKFRDGYGSKGDSDSIAGGLYATWLHKDGWYVDSVLKAQYFSNSFDAGSDHGEFDNYGLGVSFEVGKRFSSGAWFFEPSAQFAYTHLLAEDYTSRGGVGSAPLHVSTDDSDIFRYSLSLRAGRTWELKGRGIFEPYAKVGFEHQESDGGSLRVSGMSFTPTTDGNRVNLGFGASWQFTSRQQVFLDYEASFGDKYDKPWSINAGYRLRF
jgi:outer membrane autotransporter protein